MDGSLTGEFWQRLLAAEAPAVRHAELIQWAISHPGAGLATCPLLSRAEAQRAAECLPLCDEDLTARGISLLTGRHLPERYRAAEEVSGALFCQGDAASLFRPCVAIVGTRNASAYGLAAAQKFAEGLARAGATVVSGGALGIDAAAHQGALAVGGATAAVLLTSIERVYPAAHAGLFQRIRASGCLVSEFGLASTSAREFRPLVRNRTVAALSDFVLVIEAPERSGSLSTANAAREFGRTVGVVPATIDMDSFRGSHRLIRDGAALVTHPDEVLDAIGLQPVEAAPAAIVTGVQEQILSVLSVSPIPSEFIVERTGLETADVLSELTLLEMDGHIIQTAGGFALRP